MYEQPTKSVSGKVIFSLLLCPPTEKLPSSPVDFHIRDIGSTHVVVTWGASEHGGADVVYDLFYRSVEQAVYAKVDVSIRALYQCVLEPQ